MSCRKLIVEVVSGTTRWEWQFLKVIMYYYYFIALLVT